MSGKKVHFIGVGGVGMAGLAVLAKSCGHEVSGCDLKASPRTRWLESQGVRVSIGHSPMHVEEADEVVVTPAVPRGLAEYLAAEKKAKERGDVRFLLRYRGEVLADMVSRGESVAICGSHGKTTTATWTARLLIELGEDVVWCIGGETGAFPVAGRSCPHGGAHPVMVVEADESDGTLALYHASTLVVTNCEYDHPDHFKSEAEYRACYDAARRNAGQVIESESLPPLEGLTLPEGLPPHNRRNARAAAEVALRRGHSLGAIVAALPEIVAELPDRRFQRIGEGVYIDYAHHPTEMRCAVQMARQVCRGCLRVLFQPHRYSRTRALLRDFAAAFAGAEEVILCPTYAAFEQPVEGGDVADLYAACRGRIGGRLFLARSCEEAWTHAKRSWHPGDVTLVLGAGDIVGRLTECPPERIFIGAGANMWKSDLNLDVAYVRTEGPAGAPGATLGIPWMAGIPGTIGGWVKMNAGAFGHSISEAIEKVRVDGVWLPAADCGFGYRRSDIKGEIQDVVLKPSYGTPCPPEETEGFLRRRRRFPAGTFGSFFKNPEGDFAGRLLEAVGAKSLRVGGAFVWEEHANVIVRGDGATPSDVLALARIVRNRVLFRFGIALEPEVCGIVF